MRAAVALIIAALVVTLTAPAAQARAAYAVTVTASRSQVDVGQSFTLSGQVTPAARGKKVTIQRRYGTGSWRTIGTATLKSSGSYAKTIKATKAAPTSYRVLKAKSSSRSAGTSRTVGVGAYRWRHLTDLPSFRGSLVGTSEKSAVMLGVTYPHSLLVGGSASAGFETAGLCDDLTTYAGIDQRSTASATVNVRINRLVNPLDTSAPGIFNQSTTSGAAVLYFRAGTSMSPRPAAVFLEATTPGNDVVAAFGTPRVHCMS